MQVNLNKEDLIHLLLGLKSSVEYINNTDGLDEEYWDYLESLREKYDWEFGAVYFNDNGLFDFNIDGFGENLYDLSEEELYKLYNELKL